MEHRIAAHFRKYKVPFFEAIPADKYGRLAELCRVKNYEPNTVLFREGDIGNRVGGASALVTFGFFSPLCCS
jgi:CRP-like cAMP-binding protein